MRILRFVSLCWLAAGLLVSLLAACLDMWFTGLWSTLAASFVFLGAVRFRVSWAMVVLASAALGVFFRHIPFVELNAFMDKASVDIERRGAAALSTRNRIGVYGLNLAMGGIGYAAGFSEVAYLTWLLAVPGQRVRYRDGTFLLRDPSVRSAVRQATERGTSRVAWSRYFHHSVSPSVALAANCPLVLRRTVQKDVLARCSVQYPKNSKFSVGELAGQEVYLQEGVYWVLQQSGWLHPYEVEWLISEHEIALAPKHAEPVLLCRERFFLGILSPPSAAGGPCL